MEEFQYRMACNHISILGGSSGRANEEISGVSMFGGFHLKDCFLEVRT